MTVQMVVLTLLRQNELAKTFLSSLFFMTSFLQNEFLDIQITTSRQDRQRKQCFAEELPTKIYKNQSFGFQINKKVMKFAQPSQLTHHPGLLQGAKTLYESLQLAYGPSACACRQNHMRSMDVHMGVLTMLRQNELAKTFLSLCLFMTYFLQHQLVDIRIVISRQDL